MVHISKTLSFYKRKDVQEALLNTTRGREIAVRFGDKGFGKRPDTLQYPNDILEFAKQGVTSFHVSEERWQNPLNLKTEMNKHDIDDLRIGWDLIIDIDFPVWTIAKLITHAIIQALQSHGVKSISCKFSGNKGFHIAVPFEVFPKSFPGPDGKMLETRLLFPDSIKRICQYLSEYLDSKENGFNLSKLIEKFEDFKEFEKNNPDSEHILFVCGSCGKVLGNRKKQSSKLECPNCRLGGDLRQKVRLGFLDEALFSSRHMYRGVYSFNEKSGLVSIPVDINKIKEFEKDLAKPENIDELNIPFLDVSAVKQGEAELLIREALDKTFDEKKFVNGSDSKKEYGEFELPEEAIPVDMFPPCIQNILRGLEDGKKRSLFILVNFLSSVGWSHDKMEEFLLEWNNKNRELLREVQIKGRIRYHKQKAQNVLPPNCDNKSYYLDFRVCTPDNFCNRIKNPAQYAKFKSKLIAEEEKRSKRGRKKKKDKEEGTKKHEKEVKDNKNDSKNKKDN